MVKETIEVVYIYMTKSESTQEK